MIENTRQNKQNAKVSTGQASIAITAALSVMLLLGAALWQTFHYVNATNASKRMSYERQPSNTSTAPGWKLTLETLRGDAATTSTSTSSDPLSNLADAVAQQFVRSYIGLQQSGNFSTDTAAQVGTNLGESIKAPSRFVPHKESELTVVPDTSIERVLMYRSDMRVALASLLSAAEPEFATFGRYIQTKDPEQLDQLKKAIDRYLTAEHASLRVAVPQDAVAFHLRAVNSLGAFASIIDELVRFADDPLTSVAILRTYNDSEQELLYAFDALSQYYVRKSTQN